MLQRSYSMSHCTRAFGLKILCREGLGPGGHRLNTTTDTHFYRKLQLRL